MHLFILCGYPFAGKTTLARLLVEKLGLKHVSIDQINDERGIWDDEIGLSPEEWTNTYNEAYRRIGEFLEAGENVIDDSPNFTREQRDHLRTIAERHGAGMTVIFVDTSLEDASQRWQQNRQTRKRSDVRDEDFANVVQSFETPDKDEQVVHYNAAIAIEPLLENLKERISSS